MCLCCTHELCSHMYLHVKTRGEHQIPSSTLYHTLRQGHSLTSFSPLRLCWLVNELLGSTCYLHWSYRDMHSTRFLRFWELEIRFLCMYIKSSYPRSHFSNPRNKRGKNKKQKEASCWNHGKRALGSWEGTASKIYTVSSWYVVMSGIIFRWWLHNLKHYQCI